jgi:hypothetical protein
MINLDYSSAALRAYKSRLEEDLRMYRNVVSDNLNPRGVRLSIRSAPPINILTQISEESGLSFVSFGVFKGLNDEVRRWAYDALKKRLDGNLSHETYDAKFLGDYRALFGNPVVNVDVSKMIEIVYAGFIKKLEELYPLTEHDLVQMRLGFKDRRVEPQEALEHKLLSARVCEMMERTGLRTLGTVIRQFYQSEEDWPEEKRPTCETASDTTN